MDKSYIAAFFDGEGSAMVLTIRIPIKDGVIFRLRPTIKIAQKTTSVLYSMVDCLGYGRVVDGKNDCSNFLVVGVENTVKFVNDISPFTYLKTEQLLLLKEASLFRKNLSGNLPYSREEMIKLIDIRDRVFRLNCKTRSNLKQKYPKSKVLAEHHFVNLDDFKRRRKVACRKAAEAAFLKNRKPRYEISCDCGCGQKLMNIDKNRRPRKYIRGHSTKGKKLTNGVYA